MFLGLGGSKARIWIISVLSRPLGGPSGSPDPCAYARCATRFRCPWLRLLGARFQDFAGTPGMVIFKFKSYSKPDAFGLGRLHGQILSNFHAFAPLGGTKWQPRSLRVRSVCHTFSLPLAQNMGARFQDSAGGHFLIPILSKIDPNLNP